jgi:hemoglobin
VLFRSPARKQLRRHSVHHAVDGMTPELFPRWLELFAATCDDTLPPDAAAAFKGKAIRIADSLQRALFYRPEVDLRVG